MANFTGTTQISVINLGKIVSTSPTAKSTDNSAVFKYIATGSTSPTYPSTGSDVSNSTAINDSYEYIAFSENYDQYNVIYFFSASSLNATASTFTYTGGTSECTFTNNKPVPGSAPRGAICIDRTIYQVTGHSGGDYYAIRVTVPEAYDATATNRSPQFKLVLATNDPEIAYEQTLTISQTGCASA